MLTKHGEVRLNGPPVIGSDQEAAAPNCTCGNGLAPSPGSIVGSDERAIGVTLLRVRR